jgi:diguanylate cyclase (GGDEF)-like protein
MGSSFQCGKMLSIGSGVPQTQPASAPQPAQHARETGEVKRQALDRAQPPRPPMPGRSDSSEPAQHGNLPKANFIARHWRPMPHFAISEPADEILATLAEALDLVSLGIVLLDRDLRVRFVNRRYAEMWTGPCAMLVAGAPFRALLDLYAAQLFYDVPASEMSAWLDQREAEVRAGAIAPTELDLLDGRRVLFRCIPSSDGGRILTYANITRLKQVQELQQQAHDAAERMLVEQRFSTETLESQAAYLAALAETADENARRAEKAKQQLEQEIAERRQLEAQLRRLATTDGLTGTLNHAEFLALGQRELGRVRQLDQCLAVLMLDIDHFKLINDRYGHLAGDEALKHFVAQLRAGVRGIDLLGRLGGEEFAIVLPVVSREVAWQVGERLRARVAATPFLYGDHMIGLTVSIGVAMARDTEAMLGQILARADARLYAAKEAGRNRVVAADIPVDMQRRASVG